MTAARRRSSGVALCLGIVAAGLIAVAAGDTRAAEPPVPAEPLRLRVGVVVAPPFVIKTDATWSGISIELWREIAEELEIAYELRELDLEALFAAVQDGSIDVGVGPLTVSREREEVLDFTHGYYRTGLAVAVARRGDVSWFAALREIASPRMLRVFLSLAAVLIVVAFVVWLFERGKNPDQFGRGTAGIWSALWWAVSTMTTVGYGDKAPVTVAGRVIAIIWMFTGVVIISSLTASITTTLALRHIASPIRGPDDLARHWVASVAGTESYDFLNERQVPTRLYPDLDAGLRAVVEGNVDAMVFDEPLLRYAATHEMQGKIDVLPGRFDRHVYGFAVREGSGLREVLSRVLLEKIHDASWNRMLVEYLGK